MDMMTDLYPSRVGDRASITDRRDPVVYGSPDQGPLTAEQLVLYDRDGFLAFERFFGEDEVAEYKAELDRMFAWAANADEDRIIREPGSNDVRSIFAIHRDNAIFSRLVADPRIAGMARQILGSEVYVHQSRINFKGGFVGKEFYWHSDFETWHVEDGMPRMRALSMSIALSENTPNNGPLMLVPGSHKHYVTCVGQTPDDHYKASLRKQELGTPDPDSLTALVEEGGIAAPTGPAGSLVMFDCNTLHGSNSNITPVPRSNIFIVFNSVENKLTGPFGGTQPRPEFIGHRNAADKVA